MRNANRFGWITVVCVGVSAVVASAGMEVRYVAEILPPEIDIARGLNDHGVVLGWADADSVGLGQAVKWDPATGIMTYSGIPAGVDGFTPMGINNSGDVCGCGQDSVRGKHYKQGIYWGSGGPALLPHAGDYPSSTPRAINDYGYIVGGGLRSVDRFVHRFGALWYAPTLSVSQVLPDLPTPPSYHEFRDINGFREAVGEATSPADGRLHAVRYDPFYDQTIDLGKPAGSVESYAEAINESQVVVGYGSIDGGNRNGCEAVYWDHLNIMHDVHSLLPSEPYHAGNPYSSSWARDINDGGTILLGAFYSEYYDVLLFTPGEDAVATNVEHLLAGPSVGLDLHHAMYINNPGQILCYSEDSWASTLLHPYEVAAEPVPTGPAVPRSLMGGADGPDPGGCDAVFDSVTQAGTFTGHYDTCGLDTFAAMFLQDPDAKAALAGLLADETFQYWVLDFEDGDFSAATITLHYDDALLATEVGLVIAHFTDGEWENLIPTEVDIQANTLTVDLDSFSPLVLVVPEPGTLGLLALGFLAIRNRKRRKP